MPRYAGNFAMSMVGATSATNVADPGTLDRTLRIAADAS
jgi:hypothetical protein